MFSGSITFVFRITGLLLNFLVVFFLTKSYGESVFGNYTLIFTMVQATTMVFALGTPNALISFLSLNKIDDHFSQFLLKKGLKAIVLISLIPCSIYFFLGKTIAIKSFHNPELESYFDIIAITLPCFLVHEFILGFLIATKNFKKYNIFMFVLPNIIFMLLLLLFPISIQNQSLLILFYSISILATVTIACFFIFKKHQIEVLEKLSTKDFLKFSSPMMLSSLMIFLLNWTAIFMLGYLTTPKDVGVYNLAYKLSTLAMLVIISMNIVLAPKISELYKNQNIKELHSIIKKTTWIIMFFTLPIVMILLVFSEQILNVFGHNFIEGKSALMIITIGVMINVMTGNVDQILNMTGNQKLLQNITIFGFVLNVFLNFLLIPKFGVNGAAIASLLTNVVFNLICLRQIKKKLGFYTFC